MLTYIVPFFIQATFCRYIYTHISAKTEIQKTPFTFMLYYSIMVGIFSFVLCICGKMFYIENGQFYSGSLESVYYVIYVLSLLFFLGIIWVYRKKLGAHDLAAAISFCALPLLSVIISVADLGINLAVPLIPVDMLVIYILLQSEREHQLLHESNSDELTGLLNRRAYEDDMMQYPDVPPEQDFIYASIDINGLKVVNDTYGHAAGDELICGAAYCLKRSFGNYGRVYRTGGDEFVSMFFADEAHLNHLLEDLKELTDNWTGSFTSSLSLSVGYATKREFATETVEEMSKISDQRMYEDKDRYYANKGVDRRGQNEAHKVLCSLYTKILKINITDNTFSIVNMDLQEQTESMGYADHISEWLEGFGKTGRVHPDDLEDYLSKTNLDYMRGYFRRKKNSLSVFYRRKYSDGFKQVMMEIIPANDYTDDHQSLFLFVKNID